MCVHEYELDMDWLLHYLFHLQLPKMIIVILGITGHVGAVVSIKNPELFRREVLKPSNFHETGILILRIKYDLELVKNELLLTLCWLPSNLSLKASI